ncbi:MAG: adenosylcobinamide amidohydrolase, partial [Ornithinimicrobium sp.]
TKPTWAAYPAGGWSDYTPGTINIVVQVPTTFSTAALVGAVMTVTEAKTQALIEQGIPGTGTASDAVAIVCPGAEVQAQKQPHGQGRAARARTAAPPEMFAGPRSLWGARLAIAAHRAVMASVAGGASGDGDYAHGPRGSYASSPSAPGVDDPPGPGAPRS